MSILASRELTGQKHPFPSNNLLFLASSSQVEGGGREKVLADELSVWKSKCSELERENLKLKGELAKAKMEGADPAVALGPPLLHQRSHSAGSRGSPRKGNSADTAILVEKLQHQLDVQKELTLQEKERRRAYEGEVIKVRAKLQGVELSDQDVEELLPPAPPSPFGDGEGGAYFGEDDVENDDADHGLELPDPRSKSRPDFKRKSSMDMGIKLRRQILQSSQMLIEQEAKKIRNIGNGSTSEDWGKTWDDDDADAAGGGTGGSEEVSRMQRTLKLR